MSTPRQTDATEIQDEKWIGATMKKVFSLISLVLLVNLLLPACIPTATKPPASPTVPQASATQPSPTTVMTSTPSGIEEAGPAPSATQVSGPAAPATQPVLQAPLQGTAWQLATFSDAQGNASPPLPGSQIDVTFAPDGSLSGNAGCNNYTADYQIEGEKLTIGPVASTRKTCPDPAGVMEQETAYLAALQRAASYQIEAQKLVILDAQSQPVLTFAILGGPVIEEGVTVPPSLELASLRNTQYKDNFTASGYAPLIEGEYHEPVAGGASTTYVRMTGQVAYGRLPDGQVGAAVILATTTGGSGTFYDLALVVELDGKPLNLGSAFLGDRVQTNALKFEAGSIVVDMISQGPNDPMCCPTQQEIRQYRWQEGELQQVARQPVLQNELIGVAWRWVQTQLSDDTVISVDTPANYTLEFTSAGQVAVKADCNNGSGMYTLNGNTLTIQIQVMTTAACQPGSLSDRFLRDLNYVVSYVIENGDLYLSLVADGGIMKLQPAR